jgi:hypothetical protein
MRKVPLLCVLFVAAFAVQAAAQCPTITVKGPAGITPPGEDMTFSAEVNVVGPKLTYVWSVDKGTIIEGQGTTKITVLADPSLAGDTITATVDVGGLAGNCVGKASELANVADIHRCGHPDEWGPMKPDDERGRLDLFLAKLANNPRDVGLIVFRVDSKERLDSRNARIKFALKHVKFRGFEKSRIWFLLEPSEERLTRIYRLPPGDDLSPCQTALPPCERCLLFKGERL